MPAGDPIIGTGAVMGAGSLRPCRLRSFLSKSCIMGAQVNKVQGVLLSKMGGIEDYDSTRKAARKSQKLCICKSQPLFQTFTFYTLPHFWLLTGGKTILHGEDAIPMTLEWRKHHTVWTRWHGDGNSNKSQSKFWFSIRWAIMGCDMPCFREFFMWCP